MILQYTSKPVKNFAAKIFVCKIGSSMWPYPTHQDLDFEYESTLSEFSFTKFTAFQGKCGFLKRFLKVSLYILLCKNLPSSLVTPSYPWGS